MPVLDSGATNRSQSLEFKLTKKQIIFGHFECVYLSQKDEFGEKSTTSKICSQ